MLNIQPITLTGKRIALQPLSHAHIPDLSEIVLVDKLYESWITPIPSPEKLAAYIDAALNDTMLPFATIDLASGKAIGSTRYMNIDRANHHVEIGSTWLGTHWQRTYANTEAKLLLLTHAFETLGCLRVEFKTDALNTKSRNAILRLGAKEEGIFRRHMITHDNGRVRDSAYFSIVDSEWNEVKKNLEFRI